MGLRGRGGLGGEGVSGVERRAVRRIDSVAMAERRDDELIFVTGRVGVGDALDDVGDDFTSGEWRTADALGGHGLVGGLDGRR